ncbi:hypothetical protein QYE76_038551 [Lolium multiflorum]|uniref:Reverse transcriptase domain-containing protein n=1 Tax=Lolium multiflorum TaxID=4521 RepID=A0AAD8WTP7_LOLMU|nr:hypothetical protein QYE76_038551 [Lolium multiflorum]
MENYSLLMGAAAVMKMAVEMAAVSMEMAVVSMEKPSGALPRSGGVRNGDSCPPDLGFAMVAAGRIDQIIDSTAGCERLSFLDAYSGYNQIRLKEDDEAKTAFITPYGVFCYKTMPFGLKNAGATYQRMMQKCLATQIGKNVQVYIDDVVITSKKGSTLIEDLKETFDNLDKCLKLNPTKCSFGVLELLGFLVSARGIEANPEKIQPLSL